MGMQDLMDFSGLPDPEDHLGWARYIHDLDNDNERDQAHIRRDMQMAMHMMEKTRAVDEWHRKANLYTVIVLCIVLFPLAPLIIWFFSPPPYNSPD